MKLPKGVKIRVNNKTYRDECPDEFIKKICEKLVDINLMTDYLSNKGIDIPDKVLIDISYLMVQVNKIKKGKRNEQLENNSNDELFSKEKETLYYLSISIYNKLSKLTSPASAETIKYTKQAFGLFFAKNNAFVIPPDTTYVEIVVGVDRLEISEGSYCGIDDEDLQLVYPGYLPINGIIETKPGVPKICKEDDSSFRILFLFPSLDFKLEKMLFSIRGGPQKPWNFWRLIDN